MSDNEDFTIDAGTGNVLLLGELLRNKSSQELMDAAIYRGINVSNVKNALDTERAITSYFMLRLYHGLPLTMSKWRPPKRAKAETPPKHRTVSRGGSRLLARWRTVFELN